MNEIYLLHIDKQITKITFFLTHFLKGMWGIFICVLSITYKILRGADELKVVNVSDTSLVYKWSDINV